MLDIKLEHNQEEKCINNQDTLDINNENKITLRKNSNFLKLKKRRENKIQHLRVDFSHIKPEFIFIINNLDKSSDKIFYYLNSNDKDLISYCLNELFIYFFTYDISINDQRIIIEKNLLDILLSLGDKFIDNNDLSNLELILCILINIQCFDKGSNEYLKKLYTEPFFKFYNKCLITIIKGEIFHSISLILLNMSVNDYTKNFNLIFLRSNVFASLLKNLNEKDKVQFSVKEIIFKLIKYAMDLSNLENLLEIKDIEIINNCLTILIKELFSTSNETLLSIIYEGLYNISSIDDEYNFNKKIINGGVTDKILKSKFCDLKLNENTKKIILYALKIIANNLTENDNDCKIIYDSDIINFYNCILFKFDDNINILEAVFIGLSNISAGTYKNILKDSIIFKKKNVEKYINSIDGVKMQFIKIIKFMIYNSDIEILKFIYKSEILQYLIYLLTTSNLGNIICIKIIKLIDYYLKTFNEESKETEEYLIIYYKYKELLELSDKINKLNCNQLISSILKNIENNYK